MKTITVRDLRQRWPETEAASQVEEEILITRDSKPVRVAQPKTKRKRWNPEEDKKWIKKVYGNQVFPGSDEQVAAARADRKLI